MKFLVWVVVLKVGMLVGVICCVNFRVSSGFFLFRNFFVVW